MPKLIGNPYYARLNTPTEKVTKGKMVFEPSFQVQLALSPDQVKKAKELGLKVLPATDAIPLPYVKFTSKVTEEAHNLTYPEGRRPKVYGVDKSVLPKTPIMDPASQISVIFDLADYDGAKKGLMRAIQVLSLVIPEGYEENTSSIVDRADIENELEDVAPQEIEEEELNDSLDDL